MEALVAVTLNYEHPLNTATQAGCSNNTATLLHVDSIQEIILFLLSVILISDFDWWLLQK